VVVVVVVTIFLIVVVVFGLVEVFANGSVTTVLPLITKLA